MNQSPLDTAKKLLESTPNPHEVDDSTVGLALTAIAWALIAAVQTMRELNETLRKK